MSFTTHSGGEGGVTITGGAYVTTSGTASGTVAGASATALCVQDWSATEERKTVSVMTTCDYDSLRNTTFENEREVSRGLTFDITAFSTDEVPEGALVDGRTFGPIVLKKYTTGSSVDIGIYIPLAVCTGVTHGGAAAGEALHMFKFTGKAAGTFHLGTS